MKTTLKLMLTLGAFGLLAPACAAEEDGGSEGSNCDGGKCDTPVGDDEQCLKRQAEVLNSSQRGFTETDVRWACADVQGVTADGNGDSRGQEYCEYFAIFQPPGIDADGNLTDTRPEAVDLGRNLDGRGNTTELGVCFDGEGSDCRVELNEEQGFWLEDNPDEVVGACVFTSWHADVPGPLPACEGGDCGDDAQIFGFPFTADFFRMKVGFNSNRAAADLVAECFALSDLNERSPSKGYIRDYDWANGSPDDNLRDPFFRGCVGANALFGTGWRRSDPSVCAAANRLRECGCTATGLNQAIEEYKSNNDIHQLAEFGRQEFTNFPPVAQAALVVGDILLPHQPAADGTITKRGFELATWDDRKGLPPGCKYAATGEEAQSLVLCDITAGDLLQSRTDTKEFCRATYGNNVVVHVPLPVSALSCSGGDGPEADSCGNLPWNIGQEGATAPDPEPEPEPEPDTDSDSGDSSGEGDSLGNCAEARDETGCEHEEVEKCVCDQDSWCCENNWDETCVGEVTTFDCAGGRSAE